MLDRANAGVAETFRGIGYDDAIAPGLFALEKTSVLLAPLVETARAFVSTLAPATTQSGLFRNWR